MKVLVIDDEKNIRQSLAAYLEDNDYDVITAENGRQGLAFISSEKPDLVLLDLRMPGMDGIDVLRHGKKIIPDLPVIVISGANHIGGVVKALRHGAWDYLEKPIKNFTVLDHSINRALEKNRLIQENKAYQENLESMVKERTCELKNANTHLFNINARLHKIVETTQRLHGCVEMEHFGKKVLEEFAAHMAAGGGSLYLLGEDGLRLVHSIIPGHTPEFIPFPLPDDSVFKTILEKGQALLVDNIKEENIYLPSGWPGYSNGSFLAFPIREDSGNPIGVITLHNKQSPPFVAQDKEIGAILSSYCCETIRAIKAFQESKRKEIQLQQAQKMEAIGTLAGGIAHDFNNILSGIIGYAELAKMDIGNNQKAQKNIGQVMNGARRASEIVSQILTFSRQAESEMQPLKIYLIVKEAVKFLRSSIPSTIQIIEKIDAKGRVVADATQIHQVVMNLCTNAYHAMRETGGTLSIYLRNAELSREELEEGCPFGEYIALQIKDTGCGIDKKIMGRIFDPYFTTKEVSQGTGLGLAVVSSIVKKHNGMIKVYSRIGKGTVVDIFFPVFNNPLDKCTKPEYSIKNSEGTERILLVDDEHSILDCTQQMLANMGYTVSGFTDGISAFKAFEEKPDAFDLVITDMSMPNMDGRLLSEKILSLAKDTPIILCTGFHETFTEKDAAKMGIRRYLHKPVPIQTLTLAIRDELGKLGENHGTN
ncbi:response regulator [Desulfobacter curvatus]|uniref:response regulator n=1 Tax=Desulfobacter curvatus TaxID=2290 RepID=UPI00035F18AF|nr:response regulator [Desulfobacter curvatus]